MKPWAALVPGDEERFIKRDWIPPILVAATKNEGRPAKFDEGTVDLVPLHRFLVSYGVPRAKGTREGKSMVLACTHRGN